MLKFENKNIIITGASRGIGFEIAKKFIKQGANISICSKDPKKMKLSVKKLEKYRLKNQKILYKAFDICNENKIRDFIKFSLKKLKKIDILVNNAGIYGPKGLSENVNLNKIKKTFEVNFYASIIFSKYIIKHFKKNNYGKILQLAGGGISGPIPRINAYGSSKIAVVRYMESLAHEVKDFAININCIAPGAINTSMLQEIIDEGPKNIGAHYYKKALYQKKHGGTSYKNATDLASFLCSDESSFLKGKIIHALWDDWKNFYKNKNKIASSDMYTLKRVNSYDKGFNWGVVKKRYKYDKLFAPKKND